MKPCKFCKKPTGAELTLKGETKESAVCPGCYARIPDQETEAPRWNPHARYETCDKPNGIGSIRTDKPDE